MCPWKQLYYWINRFSFMLAVWKKSRKLQGLRVSFALNDTPDIVVLRIQIRKARWLRIWQCPGRIFSVWKFYVPWTEWEHVGSCLIIYPVFQSTTQVKMVFTVLCFLMMSLIDFQILWLIIFQTFWTNFNYPPPPDALPLELHFFRMTCHCQKAFI